MSRAAFAPWLTQVETHASLLKDHRSTRRQLNRNRDEQHDWSEQHQRSGRDDNVKNSFPQPCTPAETVQRLSLDVQIVMVEPLDVVNDQRISRDERDDIIVVVV